MPRLILLVSRRKFYNISYHNLVLMKINRLQISSTGSSTRWKVSALSIWTIEYQRLCKINAQRFTTCEPIFKKRIPEALGSNLSISKMKTNVFGCMKITNK